MYSRIDTASNSKPKPRKFRCDAPARNRRFRPRQTDTWRLNDATFIKLLLDFTRDTSFSEQRRNCTNDFDTRKTFEQIGAPSARSPGVH
jgi:hypothetical protein